MCNFSYSQNTPLTVEKWAINYSSSNHLHDVSSFIDQNGNLYTTGFTFSFSHKKDIVVTKIDNNGVVLWSSVYDGPVNHDDISNGIIVDPIGNIYVSGTSTGHSNNSDLVLLKFDPNGSLIFNNYYDNGQEDSAIGIGLDTFGNIYIGANTTTTANTSDFLIVKFDNSGNILWDFHYDYNYNNENDKAIAFRTSLNGTSFITGNCFNNSTQKDIVTLAVNSGGNKIWESFYNNPFGGNEEVKDLEIDLQNNVYICGNTEFDNSDFDYITIKYNSNGIAQWENIYEGSQKNDMATSIGFDNNSGDVFVTGREWFKKVDFEATTLCYKSNGDMKWIQKNYDILEDNKNVELFPDFNGGTFISATTRGQSTNKITSLHYNKDGSELWKKQYNIGIDSRVTDIILDFTGNLFVTGQTGGSSNYEFLSIKYGTENTLVPPDYYGETSSNTLNYYQSKGQIANHNGVSADEILFHSINFSPTSYLLKDRVSFVKYKSDTTPGASDSTHRVDMVFNNTDDFQSPVPFSITGDRLGYYLAHIEGGRENINGYNRIVYKEIKDGIDMYVNSNKSGHKYNFVVKVGGDPNSLELNFEGANSITVGSSGELIIGTSLGNITFVKPNIYQIDPLNPTTIIPLGWQTNYNITNNVVTFPTQSYDLDLPLVIQMDMGMNPTAAAPPITGNLDWSTYYNGISKDFSLDITHDNLGNTYMCGVTISSNFPVTGGSSFNGNYDAFITQFNNIAERKWSVFYGGTINDEAKSIAVSGNSLYVLGSTSSTNITIKPNVDPLDGSYYQDNGYGTWSSTVEKFDAMILRFDINTSGNPQLTWATYFGGIGDDVGVSIKVRNGSGDFYITGNTKTSTGAYNSCEALSTTVGNFPLCNPSSTTDYHQSFNAGGYDIFLVRFNKENDMLSSTFFGSDEDDKVFDMDLNNTNIYLVGSTKKRTNTSVTQCATASGGNFPLCKDNVNAYYSEGFSNNVTETAFISKFNLNTDLIWSTIFDYVDAFETVEIRETSTGNSVFAAGYIHNTTGQLTNQPTLNKLPIVTPTGSYQQMNNNGYHDVFITQFNDLNTLTWSTFYGDNSNEGMDLSYQLGLMGYNQIPRNSLDIDFDSKYNMYLIGNTSYNSTTSFTPVNYSGFYNQTTHKGVSLFVAGFSQNLSNFWKTLFGGLNSTSNGTHSNKDSESGSAISIGNGNKLHVVGYSLNKNFPKECPSLTAWCQNVPTNQLIEPSGTISRFDLANAVGINENKKESKTKFKIYPNPSNSEITILTDDFIKKITIYNSLGKLVIQKSYENNITKAKLNIDKLTKGLYLVQVNNSKNQVLNEKLIVE